MLRPRIKASKLFIVPVDKFIVHIDGSPISPVHGAEGLCVKKTSERVRVPLADWITQALLDPAAETVQIRST
jgi:hypothetical protein